ncbi:response regulator [Asticcacaulis solisilvae]|uniref:response regulator n=1 Tax=Asticcacaulis solisilvae TaxID=1217274 RepID=UPI003FD8FA59
MPKDHFVHFENARLLVVDDDPILREFAAANLATPKVEVEVAADGDEAWHRLSRGDFDIALIDLDMPVMDGFELIGLIRADERLKHLPLVIATGREDMDAVDRAYAAGATSFVVKPLNWRLVSHQLSYVLRASRDEAFTRKTVNALRRKVAVQDEILSTAETRLERLAGMPATVGQAPAGEAPVGEVGHLRSDIERLRHDLARARKLVG